MRKGHYFARIEETNEVFRKCPICEVFLDKIDFAEEGDGDIFLTLWDDERVAIPCCTCYKKLMRSTFGKYEVDDRVWEMVRYHENSNRIKNNLKKFGIAFTEQKEIKP